MTARSGLSRRAASALVSGSMVGHSTRITRLIGRGEVSVSAPMARNSLIRGATFSAAPVRPPCTSAREADDQRCHEDVKLVEMMLLDGSRANIEQRDDSFLDIRTTLPAKIARLRRRAYDLVRKPNVRQDIETLRLYLLARGKLSAEFIDTFRVGRGRAPPRNRRTSRRA